MPRPLEFHTQKQAKPCLPLRGRWLGASRDGGSAPGSIGHSPSHAFSVPAPSRRGPRDCANRQPLPPLIRPFGPLSSGMTATGSHVHFYSLRGAQPYTPGAIGRCFVDSPYRPSSGPSGTTFPQGKAFLCPGRSSVDLYRSIDVTWRARHASPLQYHAVFRTFTALFQRQYPYPGSIFYTFSRCRRGRGRWVPLYGPSG